MKLPYHKSLLILVVLISTYSYSQSNKKESNFGIIFSPGYTIQGNSFLDLNLLFGNVNVQENVKLPPLLTYSGLRIGLESNLRFNEDYVIAPKIGYEHNIMLFTFRGSVINYFQNDQSELRVLPEIGLSLFTLVDFTYGYGIPINNAELNNVSNHRFTIRINLNKKLNGQFFYSDLPR